MHEVLRPWPRMNPTKPDWSLSPRSIIEEQHDLWYQPDQSRVMPCPPTGHHDPYRTRWPPQPKGKPEKPPCAWWPTRHPRPLDLRNRRIDQLGRYKSCSPCRSSFYKLLVLHRSMTLDLRVCARRQPSSRERSDRWCRSECIILDECPFWSVLRCFLHQLYGWSIGEQKIMLQWLLGMQFAFACQNGCRVGRGHRPPCRPLMFSCKR
jgi:hypothetical protein